MDTTTFDHAGIVAECGACGQKNRLLFNRLGSHVRCGRCKQPISLPVWPIEVPSSADFDHLLANSAIPVVVDFWAPWCGPCRMVAPELVKVAAHAAGRYLVVKVNTDVLSDLGERLRILSIPTLAVYVDGREIARTTGARPAADIEAFIDSKVSATRSGS